jgi:hypothetical protein
MAVGEGTSAQRCLRSATLAYVTYRAATRAVTATVVEKWPVEWLNFSLMGRHGQRDGRDRRQTGLCDNVVSHSPELHP